MRLSDLAEARAKWAKKHGKLPKHVLVPSGMEDEIFEVFKGVSLDAAAPIGGKLRILGMSVEYSPFKSKELDFA